MVSISYGPYVESQYSNPIPTQYRLGNCYNCPGNRYNRLGNCRIPDRLGISYRSYFANTPPVELSTRLSLSPKA